MSLADQLMGQYRAFETEVGLCGLSADVNSLFNFSYFDSEHKRNVNHLTWNSSAKLSYLFGEYLSVDQYLQVLQNRDFVILFSDYSVLQLEYKIAGNDILTHRLCYMPSPVNFDPEFMFDYSALDYVNDLGSDGLRQSLRMVTPVRFDFDSNFRDDKHEYSHLTLNKDTCRVPGYGPVSFGHFFKFIIRYFYEDYFFKIDWKEILPEVYIKTIDHPRPHELYFDSSIPIG